VKVVTDYWSLVTGYWSLITGHWSLVAGYWSLVTGHWSLVTGHWLLVAGYWLLVAGWLLAACQPAILNPPRLATATAQAQATATATADPVLLAAPTTTAVASSEAQVTPAPDPNATITVWINETSMEHEQALQAMMAEFTQERHIDVELMLVSPLLLPKLMQTAVLSDTLPDIVLHPIEYTVGWAERGILDVAAADRIIDQLGRDTFDPAALALVSVNGLTAALPSDGYQQLLIYRADWFAEQGLPPPDTYAAMMAAAETLFNRENLISGLVIPTESNLTTTHQAFEHIATANGCQLIDDNGEVLILEPACQAALDFYFTIVNRYSPIGVQTDTSARNAYLAGRTSMIMASPDMLLKLAGLDDSALPSCAECISESGAPTDYLAQNSGIITHLTGGGPQATAANFGEISYLGITTVADQEAAAAFADYWFNDGYMAWLDVETERKVPLRWGVSEQPRRFIDSWGMLPLREGGPALADVYDAALVDQLRNGIADSNRWGFRQGQGALIATLYEQLTLSIVLQEMLSGYFNTNQTLFETYRRVIDLIPNYPYEIEIEPTATPES
jgi:multiple sugar transport system substrate-binding protein